MPPSPAGRAHTHATLYSLTVARGGAGITNADGLHLKSFRGESGLVAEYIVQDKYQAFPGIVNGGIVGTLLDCHGNWTAGAPLLPWRASNPSPPSSA